MRFSARAMKTLPRTWFMSVTVLSLPEREANSAASFSDSRRCCSSRAWWMQKEEWPFLRSMRQVRPAEDSGGHLLLFGLKGGEFNWNLKRRWDCHRDTESTETGRAKNFVRGCCYECSCDWTQDLTRRMLP